MAKRSPIFYSALILTGVNLLLRFVSTSFQVYISGRIGAEGVGLLQLVLSVGGLAMTAGMGGIRTATMYLTAEQLGKKKPDNISHTLSACVIYSIVCSSTAAILLSVLAPQIAAVWIGNPGAVKAIRIFAGFVPVCCLCGVMTGYFTAAGRIKTLAAVEVAEQLVSMAVTMSLLTLWAQDHSIRACQCVIFGSGVGACLTLATLVVLRIAERAPVSPPFPIRKRLLDAALPLAVADDLKAGINTVENLMVPKRLALYTAVQTPLAAFGTVCGMVFPVLMFPAAIVFSLAELLIPELARCHAANSTVRIAHLTKQSLKVVFLYGCFFGGGLYLSALPLCLKLYQSVQAGYYLKLYAFLAPMLYCDAIVDAMNKGMGKQKISVQFNLLTAVLDVLFLFFLLPRYGMTGYFVSFFITHLLNFLLSLRLLLRTVKGNVQIKIPLFTGFSVLAATCLSSLVSDLFVQLIAYFLIFACLLILTQVITREDIRWLKGLIK